MTLSGKELVKIAMIDPNGGHGGMDYYDFGLSRGLVAAGCRVSLYTCDETVDPGIPGLRVQAKYQRVFGPWNRWMRAFRYLRGSFLSLVIGMCSGERIFHFHLGPGSIPDLCFVALSKLCGRWVIITVHDVESFAPRAAIDRRIIRSVYKLADRLVVHNKTSQGALTERLGLDSAKIQIIRHGNYLDSIDRTIEPGEAKRSLGIQETSKVVLFFGQIKDAKGLDILLRAIPDVARDVPEVKLLIAGRPWKNEFSTYEALIEELSIRERCVLHINFIPRGAVERYLRAADIVVLPYRKIYQSGVLLLAMSYGKAVVVSDIPGMTEIITNGVNGYVFATGSSEALSATLIRALKDCNARERVAAEALEYVRQNHNWMQIGRATADLYRVLITT